MIVVVAVDGFWKWSNTMHRCKYLTAAILCLTLLSFAAAQSPSTMQLILLGTGYPWPSAERAGSSCAIVVGKRTFIVDAGRGTGMRLAAAGISWKSINSVFLTHLHSDHIDGLPDLFHSTWQFGSGMPFMLYGPRGTQEVADGMLQFYGPDIRIRRDLTEKLPPEGATIKVREIQEGVVHDIPVEVRITAFLVDHPPVTPAFGFRFDAGQRSIVISGDTRPSANLIRFAQDADVLVHEAYVGARPPSGAGKWTIASYHTSAKEAGEVARKAKVKTLVLTHLIPDNATDRDFLDEARKEFSGKIMVGRDLMRIDPADPSGK